MRSGGKETRIAHGLEPNPKEIQVGYLIYELGQARIADLHRDAERRRRAGLGRAHVRRRRRGLSLRSLFSSRRTVGRSAPMPASTPGSSA